MYSSIVPSLCAGIFTVTKEMCAITTLVCNIHYYIYMSTAVCKYHTDQCTMCKYGGKLSLIAGQHVTATIN